MAEPPEGQRSARFDRIARPHPTDSRHRHSEGKEALYSTSPGAAPSSPVLISCPRCTVERGLDVVGLLKLLKPPFLFNPIGARLYTACPSCGRWAWLRVSKGQALRALLDRRPGR